MSTTTHCDRCTAETPPGTTRRVYTQRHDDTPDTWYDLCTDRANEIDAILLPANPEPTRRPHPLPPPWILKSPR